MGAFRSRGLQALAVTPVVDRGPEHPSQAVHQVEGGCGHDAVVQERDREDRACEEGRADGVAPALVGVQGGERRVRCASGPHAGPAETIDRRVDVELDRIVAQAVGDFRQDGEHAGEHPEPNGLLQHRLQDDVPEALRGRQGDGDIGVDLAEDARQSGEQTHQGCTDEEREEQCACAVYPDLVVVEHGAVDALASTPHEQNRNRCFHSM